ncbi:hypothetical protein vseg_001598 [Gypsophila vaccaria]
MPKKLDIKESSIITSLSTTSTCTSFIVIMLLLNHISNGTQVDANLSCLATSRELNSRPVIGILTHPRRGYNGSYIGGSYVRFVESGGARVIPLIYDEPWSVLSHKLDFVNGVLFTGGTLQEGPYVDVLRKVFWDDGILESTDARNMKATLKFVDGVDNTNSVFGSFPPFLRQKLEDECLTMHYHKWGITKETFDKNELLSKFFKVLATSEDRNQEVFVSTIQAHRYPITGYQWHPEKNAFEWGLSEIPHSLEAVQVTQYAANYFISEARKSDNNPPAEIIDQNLIYRYNVVSPGDEGEGFDEMYVFDSSSPNSFLSKL